LLKYGKASFCQRKLATVEVKLKNYASVLRSRIIDAAPADRAALAEQTTVAPTPASTMPKFLNKQKLTSWLREFFF
jgi:hypothetical protein